MIIAVDYDGTLYREAGKQKCINTVLIRQLIARQLSGDAVILFTCRHGHSLREAVTTCAKYGLVFNAVNNNVPEVITRMGCNPRKVYADIYIDDKAIRP